MIVFELTMPYVGSWNGKWTGADRRYIQTRSERDVPRERWNNDYYYRWDDGWGACVSTTRMPAREAARLRKQSAGFYGYDWMIESIIERGYIISDSDIRRAANGT